MVVRQDPTFRFVAGLGRGFGSEFAGSLEEGAPYHEEMPGGWRGDSEEDNTRDAGEVVDQDQVMAVRHQPGNVLDADGEQEPQRVVAPRVRRGVDGSA